MPGDDGGADIVGVAEDAPGLAELPAGLVAVPEPAGAVVWASGWLGPHALSISAAAAAAVDMTNPWKIR